MKKIAVFLENKEPNVLSNVGLELLSEVKRIVTSTDIEIHALWLGAKLDDDIISKVASVGANKLIAVENSLLEDYDTIKYACNLAYINNQEKYDILLIGSSLIGRDLGPRLSAKLRTGLTADATSLEVEETEEKISLLATRPALGGNIFATIICPKTLPQMATIRPGVFKIDDTKHFDTLVVKYPYFVVADNRVKIVSKACKVGSNVDLTKAKLIISGGRGVASNFDKIIELASLLEVDYASSRALVDTKVSSKEHQVGQTGVTVAPKIYLSFGISGAIQHLAGMDKS
ncbi:MAG: electron transfer flavoprotein subunit alpha/FixB family protein, partial [Acholeplasmatales bacterium]|nr:electron transfer flavoprotein subunit alpha/FixB family protein [Acholeplasmatales bacterium]